MVTIISCKYHSINRIATSPPIAGVLSDGQQSIRNAAEVALPQVPHGLCHFHYLREAAKPIYATDRHAKKELKKQVRGVRAIERSVANSNDPISETVRGYCLAVRSALTDDGRPPLEASGLKLRSRLTLISKPKSFSQRAIANSAYVFQGAI